MIVPLQLEHAARVAEIHCAALAGDFLPSLGKEFLTIFYRGVLELEVGFGFVELKEREPVGFVLASSDTSALFKQVMTSRAIPLGLRVIAAVIRRPGLVGNVLETFLYPGKEDVPEKAELVVIGIDAAYRGRGLGRQLVDALNDAFRARRIQSYKVTVLQTNLGANGFYQKLGFKRALEFELYRKKWNLYTHDIQKDI